MDIKSEKEDGDKDSASKKIRRNQAKLGNVNGVETLCTNGVETMFVGRWIEAESEGFFL